MLVSAIVAIAKNNIIGRDNAIPWYLPADLKYFKQTTLNHHILMGRKCYQSIGNPLPKRTNIIVSRDPFFISSNCKIVRSIDEGLEFALENGETEVFIIGGGEIYAQSTQYWDKIYVTEVDIAVEGNVFFPPIDPSEWTLAHSEAHQADEKNEFNYIFKIFTRKF